MSQATVAGCAELALHLLQQLLHLSASLHPRELALVEDQLARFSIWTSSIGVFAPGRASMDHRLREAPDVHDAVTSLLEALSDSVQDSMIVLHGIVNTPEGASTAVNEGFDSSVQAVGREITLLYRLSNTIRRASKESQKLKVAASYRIRDDDGNDAEPLLQELYANYICGRFPDIADCLRQRLASSMVLRRKRIMYRRLRHGEKPIRTNKTVSQPMLEPPVSRRQEAVAPGLAEVASAPNLAPPSGIIQSAADYHRVSAPSVISATKTVALGSHEELVFPPAPIGRAKQRYKLLERQRKGAHWAWLRSLPVFAKDGEQYKRQYFDGKVQPDNHEANDYFSRLHYDILDANTKLQTGLELDWNNCLEAVGEILCPFCLYALPCLSVNDERIWRAHVTNDLDAYVCLFDDCDRPGELFSHSSDWLQHMRRHTLRWRCNSKSHGPRVFLKEDDYLGHMREAHPSSFTEPQLRVLAERNSQLIGPIFEFCPLCGAEDSPGDLEDHIVGHLRFLALKSLPPFEDEGSESSGGGRGSSVASTPVSRTTINKDPERYIRPTFNDPGTFPISLDREPGSLSPYAPWGGYRKYLARHVACAAERDQRHGVSHTINFMPPDDLETKGTGWFLRHYDPSIDFVEESLFDGTPPQDRRRFEWGFLTEAGDGRLESPANDAIIRSLLKRRVRRLKRRLVEVNAKIAKRPAVAMPSTPGRSSAFASTEAAQNSAQNARFREAREGGLVDAFLELNTRDGISEKRNEAEKDEIQRQLQQIREWTMQRKRSTAGPGSRKHR